jgi:hypothetical protein
VALIASCAASKRAVEARRRHHGGRAVDVGVLWNRRRHYREELLAVMSRSKAAALDEVRCDVRDKLELRLTLCIMAMIGCYLPYYKINSKSHILNASDVLNAERVLVLPVIERLILRSRAPWATKRANKPPKSGSVEVCT